MKENKKVEQQAEDILRAYADELDAQYADAFDAILVEKDGTVSVTENIADQFTPDDAVKKTEIITKHSSRTHVRLGA